MLRLSKLTDYAVVVLLRLGQDDQVRTTPCLSALTGVPEPTVAKVLKLLTACDMVSSARGPRGGYRLAAPLERISVADVIAAIDGPIALTACVDGGSGLCEVQTTCGVRGRWNVVNEAIRAALDSISLADLNRHPAPFQRVAAAPLSVSIAE
jgi:FeS assembly SUF system regulator